MSFVGVTPRGSLVTMSEIPSTDFGLELKVQESFDLALANCRRTPLNPSRRGYKTRYQSLTGSTGVDWDQVA